jgi:hypothetical protein
VFAELHERSAWEIVAEDLLEAAALFGHGLRATLTEADAMSLAGAFEDELLALLVRSEIVAGHGVPAETPVHGKSSGFACSKQRGVL